MTPVVEGAEPVRHYPVMLGVAGRRVVVVGGGRVATRRLRALLAAGADLLVLDPHPTPEVTQLASEGRLVLRRRPFSAADLDGAWFVHACTDDAEVNAAVATTAERQRIWCVRADDATASTAWTPASGRTDGLTVAVSAGGDPRRAREARDAILAGLGNGTLPSTRHRDAPARIGRVALIGGGPGDPELLTVRGRRLLLQADVVIADRLGPRAVLAELPDHVKVIDVGKTPHGPAAAQPDINALLVSHAQAGQAVVRLKGGDPFIFGRGGEELLACAAAGVDCEIVPGVTSAVAAPALAGIPLTHRGVAQEFVVAAGYLPPGDPRSSVDWTRLGASSATLVLLMAVEQLPAIAAALLAAGRPAATPVACVEQGSTPAQRVVVTDLAAVRDAPPPVSPPAVVVIGEVVRLRAQATLARAESERTASERTAPPTTAHGRDSGHSDGGQNNLHQQLDPVDAVRVAQ